jgi:hypothetical protein
VFTHLFPGLRAGFRFDCEAAYRFAVVTAVIILIVGCQSINYSSNPVLVRVIDGSFAANGVDVYVVKEAIAYNVGASSFTNYVSVSAGTQTVTVYPSGTQKLGAQVNANFTSGQQYSVLLSDQVSGYQAAILPDKGTPPPAGQVSLRFLNEASNISAMDIYAVPDGAKMETVSPLMTGVTFETVGTYLALPVGKYTVVVTAAGATKDSVPLYTSGLMQFTDGQVRTLMFVAQPLMSKPTISMKIGNDLN